ncbi:MAG: glycosyltransferase family 2 protein [Bacteroidia bacterium]
MPAPLLSVITVNYNNLAGLERTFNSVFAQTRFDAIEYIVIDGGSKDGSRELIEQHAGRIRYWVSEPDRGLYHAMNKGMEAAKGDYLWFMNSGDAMFGPDSAAHVLEAAAKGAAFIYGDTMFIRPDGSEIGLMSRVTPKKLPEAAGPHTFRFGMNICHQSLVVQRALAPPYDEKYRMVADIDWIIRILKKAPVSARTPEPLARFELGGISQQRIRTSWKERYRVLSEHYGALPTLLRHGWLLVRKIGFDLFRKS